MRAPSVESCGKCREVKQGPATMGQEVGGENALLYHFSCEPGPRKLQMTCTPLTVVDPEATSRPSALWLQPMTWCP